MQNKAKQNAIISGKCFGHLQGIHTTLVYRENYVLNFNITYTQL